MSAISPKTEFAFDAGAAYSNPIAAGYSEASPRGGLRGRLASAVQWLAEAPRRRAVINELESLSDYELADIGLTRADLPRVFDRDFAGGRRI